MCRFLILQNAHNTRPAEEILARYVQMVPCTVNTLYRSAEDLPPFSEWSEDGLALAVES